MLPGIQPEVFPMGTPHNLQPDHRGTLPVPKQCRPEMLLWSKLGFLLLPDICQPAKIKDRLRENTLNIPIYFESNVASFRSLCPLSKFDDRVFKCRKSSWFTSKSQAFCTSRYINLLSTIHCACQFQCHLEGHGCNLFTSAQV